MNSEVNVQKSDTFNPIKSYDYNLDSKCNSNNNEDKNYLLNDNNFSNQKFDKDINSLKIKDKNSNNKKEELIKLLYQQLELDENHINENLVDIENLKINFEKEIMNNKNNNNNNSNSNNINNEENNKDKQIRELKIQIQKLLKSDKKLKKELLYLKKKYDKVIGQSENTSLVLGKERSEIFDLKASYYTMSEVFDSQNFNNDIDFNNKNYQSLLKEYEKIRKDNEKINIEKNSLNEKIQKLNVEKEKIEKENINLKKEIENLKKIKFTNLKEDENKDFLLTDNKNEKENIKYINNEKQNIEEFKKLKIDYENNKLLLESSIEDNNNLKQQNLHLKKAMIEMKKKYDNEYKCVSTALAELIKKYKSFQSSIN